MSIVCLSASCAPDNSPKPYGMEHTLEVPGLQTERWAVAPAVNLSGHREVDPILQADLLFQQLQHVHGMTAVPVDRVVQAYAALGIEKAQSPQQAAQVCQFLGVDALIVPTVTAYDPYDPPKMAASLALFSQSGTMTDFRQSVGIFDSGDGSVRKDLEEFATGRSDPNGPMAERQYFLSMDSYSGFVYHQLIADLLGVPREPIVQQDK
jgi:hypothetical protein